MRKDQKLFSSVVIEPTNYCNFKCPFCPSESISRDKGFMSIDLADKIFKEISEQNISTSIQFGLMGEPFLHKHIFEIIDIGKKYDIKMKLFTNGSCLNDENIISILKLGIDEFYISYRAFDESSFMYNSSYNFKRYEVQIKKFLKEASEYNTINKICIKVFKDSVYADMIGTGKVGKELNSSEIEKFISRLFDVIPEKNTLHEKKLAINYDINVLANIYVRFETISKWNDTNISFNHNFKKGLFGACDGLKGHFGILWNGDVTTCCKDYNGENILGNVNENSLIEILQSEKTRKVRNSLKYCFLPTEYCRICRGGNSYRESIIHQIGTIVFYKISYFKKRLGN